MSLREQINKFLRNIIREYYKHKPLEEPFDMHLREIALESLEDEKYIRHLSFAYIDQLYNYITNVKTPLHLYYSSAFYLNPSAERMEEKSWIGSELLFDLDADRYEKCRNTIYICVRDGIASSERIDKCPSGERPIEYMSIPWQCIEKAWEDSVKLNDILKEEFGFKDIKIYFSGNKGFHIKVYDNSVLDLGRDERRLIADYITCEGLIVDKVFPSYKNNVLFDIYEIGLRKRVLNTALRRGLASKGNILGFKDVYIVEKEHLEEILKESCIEIDKVVTMDITRLSRFGNSLNMKSGLKVTEMVKNTDPRELGYSAFSPFKGSIRVKPLVNLSNMTVLDQQVSIKKGDVIKLEAELAIYLVLKNLVIPLDVSELEVKI